MINNEFENISDYDFMIVKTRRENSKDINGYETKILLYGNNITLINSKFGYKADKRIKIVSKEIDDKKKEDFLVFLEKNKMFRNYKKKILTKKTSHTVYQFDLLTKKNNHNFRIKINTNDSDTNNKYYKNSKEFFRMLKFEVNNKLNIEQTLFIEKLQKTFLEQKKVSKKSLFNKFFNRHK